MTPEKLITEVYEYGGKLLVGPPDGLRLRASKSIPRRLVEDLRAHKLAVIAAIYGITIEEMKRRAGTSYTEIAQEPESFEALAHAVSIRRMRERGEAPAHYTAVTICRRCGSVPIFPGAPDNVFACPWCPNRIMGRPIPKVRVSQ